MGKKQRALIISILGILVLTGTSYSSEQSTNEYILQARQASKELLSTLKSSLKGALGNGGPESAVKVCSELAPAIAHTVSEEHKLMIKRVSLKNRNPVIGVPDAFEKAQLLAFASMAADSKLTPQTEIFSFTDENGTKKFRYMKPLIADKLCLQCHGNSRQISPVVKNILSEKYPEDKATDHHEGDVRGAVSVIIELN